MGAFSMTGLIAAGALVGAVAFDVTINAMQDWYQIVYADAFWANRTTDSPVLRDLAREEAQINEMLRASPDFADRRVTLQPPLAPRDTIARPSP